MGISGRFPQGKPAATESRYPNLIDDDGDNNSNDNNNNDNNSATATINFILPL